jgi:hypothetical protein
MEAISKGHSAVEDGAVRSAVSAAPLSHTATGNPRYLKPIGVTLPSL